MGEATAGPRWGFLGSGKMAAALARGMVASGVIEPHEISTSDPIAAARDALAKELGVRAEGSNAGVIASCGVVVIAVKPQSMAGLMTEIRPLLTPEHLVISIAAGSTIEALENGLGSDRRIVRVMPNTPALLGVGASGYCLGRAARPDDERLVRLCLDAVGIAHRVPEPLMDAVTGLSGSGPAFVYLMIEALSDGGVRVGLPRDVATALAAQTVLGAAKMVLETGLHPGVLKDQVTSPGGTTIAGLHALERGGLRAALMDAVQAATERARELGRPAR
ncbi:MAG: pyrroline-5-carboxylate reductase [Isosphaeraceae bacterium]|nr:pyrroline-5-carboxylate reductase [Isosphaeraceae bacterium]